MSDFSSATPISERLEFLQSFAGAPGAFWQELASASAAAVDGRASAVYFRDAGGGAWKCIGVSPHAPPGERHQALRMMPSTLPAHCAEFGGRLCLPVPFDPALSTLAVWVPLPGGDSRLALVAVRATCDAARQEALLDRLTAVASAAPVFQVQHVLKQARTDVGQFSNVLDLMALLNAQGKFVGAGMMLVNELASRLRADRVSLGWERKGYIRVRAISHMENFAKNMDGVQSLETAMEEAYEQDSEVVWPAPEDALVVSRDHGRHVDEQTAGHAVSVPLRREGEPVGVLTLERKSEAFGDDEVCWLRICADQVAPRLVSLEVKDAWFGLRAWRAFRRAAASLLGFERTGTKILAILGVILVAFLFFGRWPHRLRGSFELKSDRSVVLPAPFDGFLETVSVAKGDLVAPRAVLLRLDSRDLLIEKSSALGDLNRYLREVEKSRAEGALGEMRMAEAMADQARARLERVESRLARSTLVAPFEGAVVDGDLRERVGSPVRQGEVLFRIARWDALKVQAEVDERDVDYITPGMELNLIFASRPDSPTPARAARIDPMAVTRDGANVFIVHCELLEAIEPWWRPGMSGTARFEAGKRRPIWLLTYRTLDYLRLRWGW